MSDIPKPLSGLPLTHVDMPKATQSGVYFIVSNGVVAYVGQSEFVLLRLGQHIRSGNFRDGDDAFVLYIGHEWLDIVEGAFIRKFKPILNGRIHGEVCAPSSNAETDEQALRFAYGGPLPDTILARIHVSSKRSEREKRDERRAKEAAQAKTQREREAAEKLKKAAAQVRKLKQAQASERKLARLKQQFYDRCNGPRAADGGA